MRTETHATTPLAVAVSWLAAFAAQGAALALAATGQGLGAVAGGCGWIGVTIPLHRQVWALVNQPVLNFSSLPGAGGYWLGSIILPITTAFILLTLRPKKPTLAGQLVVVQTVWWAILVAAVWLPLLDPADGHLARWLLLHNLAPDLVWLAPLAATAMAVPVSFRVLEIARGFRSDLGRTARATIILVHLVLPVVGWLGVTTIVGGVVSFRPAIGFALPVATALAFAWFRYPSPYPRPLKGPSLGAVVALVGGVVLASSTIWLAGRPLADDLTSGVLWGEPGALNNIRPWIEPFSPVDLEQE